MIWHSSNIDDILEKLNVDFQNGLSDDDATNLLKENGKNVLTTKSELTIKKAIINELKNFTTLFTLLSILVVFGINIYRYGFNDIHNLKLCLLALFFIIINFAFIVSQNILYSKISKTGTNPARIKTTVIRGGKAKKVKASDIVAGDIISLKIGDYIPADCRILRSSLLRCDEFNLTGEKGLAEKNANYPVKEIAHLNERFNMLYAGTFVSYGSATAIVVETGCKTEFAKMKLLGEKDKVLITEINGDNVPKIAQFKALRSDLFYFCLVCILALYVAFSMIILKNDFEFFNLATTFICIYATTNSKFINAMAKFCYNFKIFKMIKNNTILKNANTYDDISNVNYVLVDKSENLTLNKMKAVKIWTNSHGICSLKQRSLSGDKLNLLRMASLSCDAKLEEKDGQKVYIGNYCEIAIVAALEKMGFTKKELNNIYPRVCEIKFDDKRKLSTSANIINSKTVAIVRGSADVLLEKCTSGNIDQAKNIVKTLSKKGINVVGVACKELSEMPTNPTPEKLENNLTLLGLIGLVDPPQEKLKENVENLTNAGVKTIMLSDENIYTCCAFARSNGILNKGDKAIDGETFSQMDDKTVLEYIKTITVCSCFSKDDKLRLIKLIKENSNNTLMLGNTLEEMPLLKQADVWVASVTNSSSMVKQNADVVIKSSNFSALVNLFRQSLSTKKSIATIINLLSYYFIIKIILLFVLIILNYTSIINPINYIITWFVLEVITSVVLSIKNPRKQIPNTKKERGKADVCEN